jgi:hypothetical protein
MTSANACPGFSIMLAVIIIKSRWPPPCREICLPSGGVFLWWVKGFDGTAYPQRFSDQKNKQKHIVGKHKHKSHYTVDKNANVNKTQMQTPE